MRLARLVSCVVLLAISGCTAHENDPPGIDCAAISPELRARMAGLPLISAAAEYPPLSELVSLATKANLASTLDTAEKVTLLAPTNDAFSRADQTVLAETRTDPGRISVLIFRHLAGAVDGDSATVTLRNVQGDSITAIIGTEGTDRAGAVRAPCGGINVKGGTIYPISTVVLSPP
jgi:uncharacterized surface protein with fasciclin (FAS1) repeats